MTNYQIILFLVKDGGSYTREEHLSLLKKKFPKEKITLGRVTAMRLSMAKSKFVKTEVTYLSANNRKMKALSVEKKYERYGTSRVNRRKEPLFDSYLTYEPKEVARHILMVQEFNKLLAKATHDRVY